MNNKIHIRASMLPSWNDCPRRSAAQQYRMEIIAAGYKLNTREPSIGGIIGTSVHKGSEFTLSNYIEHSEYAKSSDCVEVGMEDFKINIVNGAIWDTTTPIKTIAEKQLIQMIKSYCIQVAPNIKPALLEQQREAPLFDDIIFSGKCDVQCVDESIRDTKGGVKEKQFQGQLGGYSILKKYYVPENETTSLFIDYLPRVSTKKNYPGAIIKEYDIALCEKVAVYTIAQIAKAVRLFRKTNNNIWAFPCNPMSNLCGDKYCTAYKTNFCEFFK